MQTLKLVWVIAVPGQRKNWRLKKDIKGLVEKHRLRSIVIQRQLTQE
jgi:hypothetical protein